MLAKVISWAPTRQAAIKRLNRGLEETEVRGIVTNIPFLSALVTHPQVRANTIDTGFIEPELKGLTDEPLLALGDLEHCAAVAAIIVGERQAAAREVYSPWQAFGWQPVGLRNRVFAFRQGHGPEQKVTLSYGSGPSTLSIGEREFVFATAAAEDGGFDLTLDGMKSHVIAVIEGHELYLRTRNGRFDLHWVDPFGGETEEQVGEDKIVVLVAPLLWEGRGIGAFHVARDADATFSDREVALLKTFADQAAIAIQNARLFNEIREALEQQKASADILAVISSSVADAQPVFDKILVSCKHLFGGDELYVLLVDE